METIGSARMKSLTARVLLALAGGVSIGMFKTAFNVTADMAVASILSRGLR
jgi:hypothetical protein